MTTTMARRARGRITKTTTPVRKASAKPPSVSSAHHDGYTDAYLRDVLARVRIIAMVGASPNWNRPSYFAMKYLQHKGYRVVPVNPQAAGQIILGEKVYGHLGDIPFHVDMVDVFRNSAAAGSLADEAIQIGAEVLWMQLGVRNDAAAQRAEQAGLTVVMNRCPKIEYGRLHGELSWSGINSGIISAKRQTMLR